MEKQRFVNKITYTNGDNLSAAARTVTDRLRDVRGCHVSRRQMKLPCLDAAPDFDDLTRVAPDIAKQRSVSPPFTSGERETRPTEPRQRRWRGCFGVGLA